MFEQFVVDDVALCSPIVQTDHLAGVSAVLVCNNRNDAKTKKIIIPKILVCIITFISDYKSGGDANVHFAENFANILTRKKPFVSKQTQTIINLNKVFESVVSVFKDQRQLSQYNK